MPSDRPNLSGWAREARAVPEFGLFVSAAGPLVALSPRGDGHPVIVLPGLGADDVSTRPIRWFLERLGYATVGWGIGRNRGSGRSVVDGLDTLLATVGAKGQRVSLVGWSLGGVHAFDLARRRPEVIRGIVTLGSPLSRSKLPPSSIPVTSIFSRSDAIVPWQASQIAAGSVRENVEVRGSHLGLGHNPAVAAIVADRLAQRPDQWRPYRAAWWTKPWLPDPG